MVAPVKLNFKIYQGSTFNEVLRWESDTLAYKAITGITKAAPAVITTIGHSIPIGWRVKVTDVIGMKEINSNDTYNIITDTTTDSITLGNLNSFSYTAYTSGGVLTYNTPVDLAGYSARMQLRSKITSTDIILELTTENGGIILDNTLKTITIFISASVTAGLDFSSCVYSLELTKSGIVTPLITGSISLIKEITR